MSTVFWVLSKLALLLGLLWGLLMVFVTFGIDLLLDGKIATDDLGSGLFWSGFSAFLIGMLINPFPWRMRHVARNPNAELVITPPLSTICGMAVGLVLMTSSCAYVLASGSADDTARDLAIVGLVVFGVTLLGLPVFGRMATLKLSSQGLEYNQFGCGLIAWPDIEAVEADYMSRSFFVTLQLRDEEKYIQRGLKGIGLRRRWVRWFLRSPLSIPTIMFNVSPAWLRNAIQIRLDHFGGAAMRNLPIVQRQGTSA